MTGPVLTSLIPRPSTLPLTERNRRVEGLGTRLCAHMHVHVHVHVPVHVHVCVFGKCIKYRQAQMEGACNFNDLSDLSLGIYSRGHRKVPVPFPCYGATVSVQRNENGRATLATVPCNAPFRLNGRNYFAV